MMESLLDILSEFNSLLSNHVMKQFPFLGTHGLLLEIGDESSDHMVRKKLGALLRQISGFHIKSKEVLKLSRVGAEKFLMESTARKDYLIILIEDIDLLYVSLRTVLRHMLDLLTSNSTNAPLIVGTYVRLDGGNNERIGCFPDEIYRFGPPLKISPITNDQELLSEFSNTNITDSEKVSVHNTSTTPNISTYNLFRSDLLPILQSNHPRITKPSGIVIEGESGSGKTYFIRWLQQQLPHYHFIEVASADLIHKEVGCSEKAVLEIFRKARDQAPAFVVIENFDILFGEAKLSLSSAFTRIQSVLLTEIDQCAETRNIIPLVTATSLQHVDSAFLRPGRLEERIVMKVLTDQERLELLRSLCLVVLPPLSELPITEIEPLSRSMTIWSVGKIASTVNEAHFNLRDKLGYDCPLLSWNDLRMEIENLISNSNVFHF